MAAKLADPRVKIDRGFEQIEALRTELYAAMESEGHKLDAKLASDTYRGQAALTLTISRLPVFSTGIGLLIGEIVHNLRSALDHLAWHLVPPTRLRKLSVRAAEAVYFPMARTQKGYWNGVNRLLPGTTNDQRAFIEQYQPYHRSAAGRAMRTLRTLSNTDKHRIIVPALYFPVRFKSQLKYEGARQIEHLIRLQPGREMKLGTPLSTWTFSGRPQNVSLDYQLTSSPAFRPALIRPAPGNSIEDVSGTLTTIAETCREIVAHFDG
jgi:hypothetical protein